MKKLKVFLLGVLIVGFIHTNLFSIPLQQDDWDRDNYGKIVGRVIDAETGKPVKEIFKINFYDSNVWMHPNNHVSLIYYIYTNEEGHFNIERAPGIYYLQFLPESYESKYELEPCPIISEEHRYKITVKSGQITNVFKKVYRGGKLKITIVDSNGVKINPMIFFYNDININIKIQSDGILGYYPGEGDKIPARTLTDFENNLNDGEMEIGRLHPGVYNIFIDFHYIGYGDKTIKDIRVIRGQTTEQNVIIDMNDGTGIEGKVTDENGNPLENVIVRVGPAAVKTDKYGDYRIIGLNEGTHKVSVKIEFSAYEIFNDFFGKVKIIKDSIYQKNLKVKIN